MLGREVLFLTELVSRLPDDDVVLLSLCQSSQFPVPVFLAADHLFDSGARMCSQCRHVFSVSTLVGTEADCPPHHCCLQCLFTDRHLDPDRVIPTMDLSSTTGCHADLHLRLVRVTGQSAKPHHVVVLLWTLQSCFYM